MSEDRSFYWEGKHSDDLSRDELLDIIVWQNEERQRVVQQAQRDRDFLYGGK